MKPDFPTAYSLTMSHEIGPYAKSRGYSVDKDDPGGETVAGVSRKFEPQWSGWKIIDEMKVLPGFPGNLSENNHLDGLIAELYREKYWNVNHLDDMPDHSISIELFDTGVNMGVKTAATYLQQTVNMLNRNQVSFPDIPEDGNIGPQTIQAVSKVVSEGNLKRLMTILNVLQGMHYVERVRQDKTQEKWIGWWDRVSF